MGVLSAVGSSPIMSVSKTVARAGGSGRSSGYWGNAGLAGQGGVLVDQNCSSFFKRVAWGDGAIGVNGNQ